MGGNLGGPRASPSFFKSEVRGKGLEININGAVEHMAALTPLLKRLAQGNGNNEIQMCSIPALEDELLGCMMLVMSL